MSEIDTETFDEETEGSRLRKELDKAIKRAKDAESRAEANESAARIVAFQKAGLPDDKQTSFFREKYDGELTAEAIQAAAAEHGFLPEQSAETAAEIDQINATAEAMTGGTVIGEGTEDAMLRDLEEAAGKPGDPGKNIAEVYARYGRQIG